MKLNNSISVRCNGVTKTGKRCRMHSPWLLLPPSSNFYCHMHADQAYESDSWTT